MGFNWSHGRNLEVTRRRKKEKKYARTETKEN